MSVHEASKDLHYLLNRGYRKSYALTFVCNHYQLKKEERYFLARAVFSEETIKATLQKRLPMEEIEGKDLAVDGFNVLITAEAVLNNEAILCDDSVMRDIQGVFGKYTMTEATDRALHTIFAVIQKYSPRKVAFYFDQQVSHSGDLCSKVRTYYACETIPHVDLFLADLNTITATSDSIVIEKLDHFIDIPFEISLTLSDVSKRLHT